MDERLRKDALQPAAQVRLDLLVFRCDTENHQYTKRVCAQVITGKLQFGGAEPQVPPDANLAQHGAAAPESESFTQAQICLYLACSY